MCLDVREEKKGRGRDGAGRGRDEKGEGEEGVGRSDVMAKQCVCTLCLCVSMCINVCIQIFSGMSLVAVLFIYTTVPETKVSQRACKERAGSKTMTMPADTAKGLREHHTTMSHCACMGETESNL